MVLYTHIHSILSVRVMTSPRLMVSKWDNRPLILVGGWALPLWKIWIRQLGWLFPIYGKIKNVPNHQSDMDKSSTIISVSTKISRAYFWWTIWKPMKNDLSRPIKLLINMEFEQCLLQKQMTNHYHCTRQFLSVHTVQLPWNH